MSKETPLLALEWTLLLGALGALTVTEEYQWYVPGALAALGMSFLVRWMRTGRPVHRTSLEVPCAMFLAAAGVGLWAAYDRSLATLHFVRIVAAMALFYALADSSEEVAWVLAGGFVAAATVLALYWPTQHDFGAAAAKLEVIRVAGQWFNAHVPRIPGPSIHANIAGGTLTLALSFAVGLAWTLWRRHCRVLSAIAMALALTIACGLLLTGNRGGWLSAAAVGGLTLLALVQRRKFTSQRAMALFWSAVVGLVVAFGAAAAATRTLDAVLGMVPDPTGAMQGRLTLWSQGLSLVRDFGFTGIGLGMFPMVFSTYGILLGTPFLTHIHNTYLEIWIEAGLLGVLALVGCAAVALGWSWRALRAQRVTPLVWTGMAALVAVAVHGMFDTVFFGTRMFPLVGLALGFAWLGVRSATPGGRGRRTQGRRLAVVAVGALAVTVLVLHRPLVSAWHANLGAVAQARVELSIYDPVHFDNPTLDEIRRTADLSRVEQQFDEALQWDGRNLTAQQRLASLALSRGDYGQGLALLQTTWERGHRDDVTRLLLGDALVAGGKPSEAADLLRGLAWAEMRLRGHAWYRYWVSKDYRRAADAWTTAILLNPGGTTDLLYWQAEAEKRAE